MSAPVSAARTEVSRWSRYRDGLVAPMPPERIAALRILVLGYAVGFLVVRVDAFWASTNRPAWRWEGVGLLAPWNAPPPVTLMRGLLVIAVISGMAAVIGYRFRITAVVFAITFLIVTTQRLSWGQVLHTEHLVVVHVIVLALAPAAARRWSLDARRAPCADREDQTGWPVRAMALATVTGYVVAGIAKLRNGGWDWIVGDVLRNQIAFDNLRKILLGDIHSPLGGWLVGYGWVFVPIAIATIVVELAAPMAWAGRWWRRGWVAVAWLFHVGILALMAIVFPYHLLGVAYAPLLAPEGFVAAVGRRVSGARSAVRTARRPSRTAS
jgi:hypothetical protein